MGGQVDGWVVGGGRSGREVGGGRERERVRGLGGGGGGGGGGGDGRGEKGDLYIRLYIRAWVRIGTVRVEVGCRLCGSHYVHVCAGYLGRQCDVLYTLLLHNLVSGVFWPVMMSTHLCQFCC